MTLNPFRALVKPSNWINLSEFPSWVLRPYTWMQLQKNKDRPGDKGSMDPQQLD